MMRMMNVRRGRGEEDDYQTRGEEEARRNTFMNHPLLNNQASVAARQHTQRIGCDDPCRTEASVSVSAVAARGRNEKRAELGRQTGDEKERMQQQHRAVSTLYTSSTRDSRNIVPVSIESLHSIDAH